MEMQLKKEGGGSGRELAAHVQAAIANGRGREVQAKVAHRAGPPMAPHVQQAVLGTAQAMSAGSGGSRLHAAPHGRPAPAVPPASRWVVQRAPSSKPDILGNTRKLIPLGRGNVLGDIRKSKGESLRRAVGTGIAASDRTLRGVVRDAVSPDLQGVVKTALGAVIMTAGNCQEHAAIAFLLALRDFPGKRVVLMSYSKDHAFVLVGDGDNLDDYVVLDVWDPGENGKRYKDCGWYGKSEPSLKADGDGIDHLGLAMAALGDKEIKRIHDDAYKKAKDQTMGFEDLSEAELKDASPFRLYDF